MHVIDLVWKELVEETENRLGNNQKVTTDLETVLNQHKEVFKDDLGTLRGVTIEQTAFDNLIAKLFDAQVFSARDTFQ